MAADLPVQLNYHILDLHKSSFTHDEVNAIIKCADLMRASFVFEEILNSIGPTTPHTIPAIRPRDHATIVAEWKRISGFSSYGLGMYSAVTHSLLYVTSPDVLIGGAPDILATALVVNKTNYNSSTRNACEIWSVASNMLYMRTGSVKFMFNNFLINILRFAGNTDVYLEVDRESFPFITFYDRLVMYYKLGFGVVSDSPTYYINSEGSNGTLNLNTIQIAYFVTGAAIAYSIGTSGSWLPIHQLQQEYPLMYPMDKRASAAAAAIAASAASAGAVYSSMQSQIIMKFMNPIGISDASLVNELIQRLQNEINRHTISPMYKDLIPISTKKFDGNSFCALFHSGYVLNKTSSGTYTGTFVTKVVPDNVELVIINSPGFYTYGPIISENWNFCQMFLQHIPMDVLKTIFRGIQPITDAAGQKAIPSPTPIPSPIPIGSFASGPTDAYKQAQKNKIAYMKAIQQNLLFHFPTGVGLGGPFDPPGILMDTIIQFQCYGSGDAYPEMNLSAVLGRDTAGNPSSTNFMAPIHGLYDINSPYKSIAHPISHIAPPEAHYFGSDTAVTDAGQQVGYPDRSKLIFPLLYPGDPTRYEGSANYSPAVGEKGFVNSGSGVHSIRLSDLIDIMVTRDNTRTDQVPPKAKKRIFIISCGATEESTAIRDILRDIGRNYIGRKYEIVLGIDNGRSSYHNFLNTILIDAIRITQRADLTRRLSINAGTAVDPNIIYRNGIYNETGAARTARRAADAAAAGAASGAATAATEEQMRLAAEAAATAAAANAERKRLAAEAAATAAAANAERKRLAAEAAATAAADAERERLATIETINRQLIDLRARRDQFVDAGNKIRDLILHARDAESLYRHKKAELLELKKSIDINEQRLMRCYAEINRLEVNIKTLEQQKHNLENPVDMASYPVERNTNAAGAAAGTAADTFVRNYASYPVERNIPGSSAGSAGSAGSAEGGAATKSSRLPHKIKTAPPVPPPVSSNIGYALISGPFGKQYIKMSRNDALRRGYVWYKNVPSITTTPTPTTASRRPTDSVIAFLPNPFGGKPVEKKMTLGEAQSRGLTWRALKIFEGGGFTKKQRKQRRNRTHKK